VRAEVADRYVKARSTHAVGCDAGGSSFLHRELGMSVDVLVEPLELGDELAKACQRGRDRVGANLRNHDVHPVLQSALRFKLRS